MSSKSRGIARERDAKRWLEAQGWWVQRGPASLGVDLVCLRPLAVESVSFPFPVDLPPGSCTAMFAEIKANRGSPYMHFRTEERAALRAAAERAGATAVLIHWPSHGQPNLIPAEFWPSPVVS